MFGTRDAAYLSVPVPSAPCSSLFGDTGGDESSFPRQARRGCLVTQYPHLRTVAALGGSRLTLHLPPPQMLLSVKRPCKWASAWDPSPGGSTLQGAFLFLPLLPEKSEALSETYVPSPVSGPHPHIRDTLGEWGAAEREPSFPLPFPPMLAFSTSVSTSELSWGKNVCIKYKLHTCHLQALTSPVSPVAGLSLSFFICRMDIKLPALPTLKGYCEAHGR